MKSTEDFEKNDRKLNVRWLTKVLPAVLLLALIFFLAKSYAGNEWLTHIKDISPTLVIILGLLSFSNYGLRTLRWHLLFKSVGINLSKKTTFYSYFSGFGMAVTPGKIGEIIRIWIIRKSENIPLRKSMYPLFGDRVTDLIAISAFSSLGFSMFKNMLLPGSIAIAITLSITLVWLFPEFFLSLILRAIKYLKIRSIKLTKLLRAIKSETKNIKANHLSPIILIISLLAWFMEGLAFWLLLVNFNVDIPITIAISIFAISILVGALSMLPGGLGGAEITMVTLLVMLNVDTGIAVAATAIIRLFTLWYAVIIGLVVLPFALKHRTQLKD